MYEYILNGHFDLEFSLIYLQLNFSPEDPHFFPATWRQKLEQQTRRKLFCNVKNVIALDINSI